jgi:hypothetical protein
MKRAGLLVLLAMTTAGCDRTFGDASGLGIAIRNPPAEIVDFTVELEFDGRELSLDCSPEPDSPGWCETSVGPWRVWFVVFRSPAPVEPFSPQLTIGIDKSDSFSSYVPQGEIRVVLSSPTAPDFHAELAFEAEVMGEADCRSAYEVWDLAAVGPS